MRTGPYPRPIATHNLIEKMQNYSELRIKSPSYRFANQHTTRRYNCAHSYVYGSISVLLVSYLTCVVVIFGVDGNHHTLAGGQPERPLPYMTDSHPINDEYNRHNNRTTLLRVYARWWSCRARSGRTSPVLREDRGHTLHTAQHRAVHLMSPVKRSTTVTDGWWENRRRRSVSVSWISLSYWLAHAIAPDTSLTPLIPRTTYTPHPKHPLVH